jgi:DUF2905 family protein
MPSSDPLSPLGRTLLIAGLLVAAAGAILLAIGRLPFLGRLPGDFVWSKENFKVYVPLATSLLLSLILTLVLALVSMLRR